MYRPGHFHNFVDLVLSGGIDDVLQNITETAQEQGVPVVFALCRSSLGRAVNKIVPVSVVGVFNHNGAEVRCSRTLPKVILPSLTCQKKNYSKNKIKNGKEGEKNSLLDL